MGSGSGPLGFRGGVGRRFTDDGRTIQRTAAALRRLLPPLNQADVVASWGGPIDVTSDRLPIVGTIPGTGVHYGCGYSGHGVSPAWMVADILAAMVLGKNGDWSKHPFVARKLPTMPAEPFRFIGGRLIQQAILREENAEESGRRSSPIAAAISRLPDLLRIPLGSR
jgi:glycine/D-amino acid oxidase-like deaminating enzyme